MPGGPDRTPGIRAFWRRCVSPFPPCEICYAVTVALLLVEGAAVTRAQIIGTGSYAPEKIMTNDDLAALYTYLTTAP